jgi:hypothetical protein
LAFAKNFLLRKPKQIFKNIRIHGWEQFFDHQYRTATDRACHFLIPIQIILSRNVPALNAEP